MPEVERLRALHDAYVWEVNAAIGEGRMDLVWQLAEDFLTEAVAEMSEDFPTGCDRVGCAICDPAVRASTAATRRPSTTSWIVRLARALHRR